MDMQRLIFVCAGTLTGCVAANYLHQFFGAKDWPAATERSYFQAAALAGLLLSGWATNGA